MANGRPLASTMPALAMLVLAVGCGDGKGSSTGVAAGTPSGTTGGTTSGTTAGTTSTGSTTSSLPTSTCGDGAVEGVEVCDDGNLVDGDGCSADCLSDETCGNGVVDSVVGEECDDANVSTLDGCDDACGTEHGWTCTGAPSACASTCGDGLVASDEECDDDNIFDLDGCNAACVVEAGYECAGEPSVCNTCGVEDLYFSVLSIGTDYVELTNPCVASLSLNGLNILFDDSDIADVDFPLPNELLAGGATVRITETAIGATDIVTPENVSFSVTRGGAALLCTGVCASSTDVIDAVAFSEGSPHPPLPPGVSFSPAGLSGIVDQFSQVYVRVGNAGVSPNFLASDWTIQ